MSENKLPWSVPVALSDIPDTGRRFELSANEETRAEVAKLAGLRALPRLEAAFDLAPHGAQGLRVTGRVAARVGQTCVVTLDPIENEVDENVNVLFAPPMEAPADREGATGVAEKNIDPDAPEPLAGDVIDLGSLAIEFLLLGIDPYPRKPGVAFEPQPAKDAGAHPFAALAALKKGQGGKDD